jgi:hypothetical protein
MPKGAGFVGEGEGEGAAGAVGFNIGGGVLERLAEPVFGGGGEPSFGDFAEDGA